MGEVIVKLITSEIVKISTVKTLPTVEGVYLKVENHMGEVFYFSAENVLFAQFKPV